MPDWIELNVNGLLSYEPVEGILDNEGFNSCSSFNWRDPCPPNIPFRLSPESGVPGAFERCEAELGAPGRGVAGTDRAVVIDKPSGRARGEPRREESPCPSPCGTC